MNIFSCRDITALVSQTLDRGASGRQRWVIEFHMLMCKWCRRYRRQLLFLRQAFSAAAKNPDRIIDEALGDQTRDAMKERLKREDPKQ